MKRSNNPSNVRCWHKADIALVAPHMSAFGGKADNVGRIRLLGKTYAVKTPYQERR